MRVLADGKTKLTMLTTKPVNPEKPTATELNAGIDLSCKVTTNDFAFGPTDSEKIGEQALCDDGNAESPGRSNYEASITLWREYLAAGGVDPAADAAFVALRKKGATVYLYGRRTDKIATAPWVAAEEIFFGCEALNDTPQPVSEGLIKYKIPLMVQKGYPFTAVGTP